MSEQQIAEIRDRLIWTPGPMTQEWKDIRFLLEELRRKDERIQQLESEAAGLRRALEEIEAVRDSEYGHLYCPLCEEKIVETFDKDGHATCSGHADDCMVGNALATDAGRKVQAVVEAATDYVRASAPDDPSQDAVLATYYRLVDVVKDLEGGAGDA